MSTTVEPPAETDASVESQNESTEPDISQGYNDGTDASQVEMPVPEDETSAQEAEGREVSEGQEPEAEAQQEEGELDEQQEGEENEPAGAAGYGQSQPQQQTPEFDAELLSRAEQVGISAHRAKTWSSPDDLRKTVNELVWRQPRAAQQPAPVPKEQPKPLTVDDFKVGGVFSADDLGESTAKQLNALRDGAAEQAFRQDQTHRKQLESIEIAMGSMVAQTQASANQRDVDAFEAHVQGNKELHPLLGKGPMRSLKAGSEQAKLREQCFTKAKQLATMYASAGERKSATEICDDATALVLNKQLKSAARGEIVSKLKSRKGQAVGTPTQRTASGKQTGEERAQARVDAFEQAHEDDQPERF